MGNECISHNVALFFNVAEIGKTYSGRPLRGRIFLPYFNKIWIFFTHFYESPQYKNFTAIRPAGAALINADVRTDGHDEGNRGFLRLWNAPKNELKH
jgi:hypothetical protein